jgi:hypothetical protein
VYASVWHTPLAIILTNTSPAFGGITSTSSIDRGCLGPQAMAAFDLMKLLVSMVFLKRVLIKIDAANGNVFTGNSIEENIKNSF